MTSEWRHVFLVPGRNNGLGKAVTQTTLKTEPIGFQQKAENESVYQTAIMDFKNSENFGKLSNNNIVYKN